MSTTTMDDAVSTTTIATSVVVGEHPAPQLSVPVDDSSFVQSADMNAPDGNSSTTGTILCAVDHAGLMNPVVYDDNQALWLSTLARQLEYYFSPTNLTTDTYLQTLCALNDGCVPLSILANFGKVRAIVAVAGGDGNVHVTDDMTATTTTVEEQRRVWAIQQAIGQGYTKLLSLYSIDTVTGTIVTEDDDIQSESSNPTIVAVGPVRSDRRAAATTALEQEDARRLSKSESLTLSSSPTSSRATMSPRQQVYEQQQQLYEQQPQQQQPSSPGAYVDNTIILRDVDPVVTLDEVQALLAEIDDCPPILGIVSDVANSWFIGLDTTDRSEMMRIMMQLRSMTFPSTGDYVMARVRASSVSQSTVAVDVYSTWPHVMPLSDGLPKKKKKKKKRSKKRNKKGNSSNSSMATTVATSATDASSEAPLQRLTEDDFPSLDATKKVEWVTTQTEEDSLDDEDDEEEASSSSDDCNILKPEDDYDDEDEERKSLKAVSDGASTATTTSSSFSSSSNNNGSSSETMTVGTKQQQQPPHAVLGGYAAALLKVPNGSVVVGSFIAGSGPVTTTRSFDAHAMNESVEPTNRATPAVTVTPTAADHSQLSWGGNPSFASVLARQPDARLTQ